MRTTHGLFVDDRRWELAAAGVVVASAILLAKRSSIRPTETTTEDDFVVYEKDRDASMDPHPPTKTFERRLGAIAGCAAGTWLLALGVFALIANLA